MPLKVLSDSSLADALGSPELAADVTASVHGGDCRICGQPIPAGATVRLVSQRIDAFSMVFVWAQHSYCGGVDPTDAAGGVLSIDGPGHTFTFKMVIAEHRPAADAAPEIMTVLILHPHVDGAVVTALPDGSMPATLLDGYLARGWTPMRRPPAPHEPAGEPPAGTAAALRGDQLLLTLDGSPRALRLTSHEADALRQTRQLYVAITFHADPATLTNEQIDALMRSDDLAAARFTLSCFRL